MRHIETDPLTGAASVGCPPSLLNPVVVELAFSRLSDGGEDAKIKGTRKVGGAGKRKKGRDRQMITGSPAPSLPSFFPCYFRVCTFSIQRTRLS